MENAIVTKKEIVKKISEDIGLTQLKTKDIVLRRAEMRGGEGSSGTGRHRGPGAGRRWGPGRARRWRRRSDRRERNQAQAGAPALAMSLPGWPRATDRAAGPIRAVTESGRIP